jgi:FKBP-type peptidyl-prolyl cis-trans isomerase SlyD
MAIKEGDFVKISFTARLDDGTIIDTTDEELAKKEGIYSENGRYGDVTIILGAGHVVQGFEEALLGKEPGEKGSVKVEPSKGFGEHNPDLVEAISITKFKERPEVGQTIRVGNRTGVVEKVIGRRAIVDFNHPLAGQTLEYEYEIKDVLEKPEDKAKALLLLTTGVDAEVEISGSVLIFKVTKEALYSEWYLVGKTQVVRELFNRLENIEKIQFVETFRKEDSEVREHDVTSEEKVEDEQGDEAEPTAEEERSERE